MCAYVCVSPLHRFQTMSVAMLEMLKDGPHEFASVIQTHFRLKKAQIIQQCETWLAAAKSPQPKKTFYGYANQEHHQLPLVDQNAFKAMVLRLKQYLGTLKVEDAITIE